MSSKYYFSDDQIKRISNHCRISQLLQRVAVLLQQRFLDRWQIYHILNTNACDWNDDEESKNEFVNFCYSLKMEEAAKTFIAIPSFRFWDINVANTAIKIMSEIIVKHLGGSVDAAEDETEDSLKTIINNIANRKQELFDDEFEIYWNVIEKILIDIGEKIELIDAFKSDDLQTYQSNLFIFYEDSEPGQQNEQANKLFKSGKYHDAIQIYDKILKLNDLLPQQQAIIYTNRSIANLKLDKDEYFKKAEMDALFAIQLFPCYGKAHYHLAKAQIKLEKWFDAEDSLNKAFVLDKNFNHISEEFNAVKSKVQMISRLGHLIRFKPFASYSDAKKHLAEASGVSENKADKLIEAAKTNLPVYFIIQGNLHRDSKNFKMAAEYFEKAAEGGLPEAMLKLALLYVKGYGLPRNYGKAVEWLTKAANMETEVEQSVSEAQHLLGLYHFDGTGVDKDIKKSVEWFEKAANNGCGESANNLGIIYKFGKNEIKKSLSKSFQYFKLAAHLGDAEGMQNLASCYYSAEGTCSTTPTNEDIMKGMDWMHLAVENGNLCAANELMHMPGQITLCKPSSKFYQDCANIKNNFVRKLLLVQHRKLFANFFLEGAGTESYKVLNEKLSSQQLSKNSRFSFSEIPYKPMCPRILKARIIDCCVFSSAVTSVIEEANGDVQRLFICNWPLNSNELKDRVEAMKIFRPNCIISIKSPKLKINIDSHSMICVDNPEDITIDNAFIDKLCHICGKEGKTLPSCAGCKMALYCSKECQQLDWIEFNHKKVCKQLKQWKTLF